jgi:myo-inositol-1(or 4)-monophosphatase
MALSYSGGAKQSLKSDSSIVTEADTAVEAMLREEILRSFPSSSIVGEEGGREEGGELLWVVDPIDGTAMYAVGGPTWCVAISVFSGEKPLACSVYAPVLNELFVADEKRVTLNGSEIRPSPFVDGPNSVLYVPSNFPYRYELTGFRGRVRNLGSGCLHVCYLCCGRGDAVLLKGGPWDVAPGFVMTAAFSGSVSNLSGTELQWRDVFLTSGYTPEPLLFTASESAATFFRERVHLRG